MDTKALVRDVDRVKSHLTELPTGAVVTNAPCKIQVPERFTAKNLAILGAETFIFGFFPIIVNEQYYCVNKTIAMMRICPNSTERIVQDGEPMIEFSFEPGDKVFYTTALVVTDTLVFYLYDEFIAKGNVPWYINYYDIINLFDSAKEHAGVNLGSRSVIELIMSTITRDKNDLTRLYRHVLQNYEYAFTNPPITIPFRSVAFNTDDTVSKLIGAYFNEGITAALVDESEKVEMIEELYRT